MPEPYPEKKLVLKSWSVLMISKRLLKSIDETDKARIVFIKLFLCTVWGICMGTCVVERCLMGEECVYMYSNRSGPELMLFMSNM